MKQPLEQLQRWWIRIELQWDVDWENFITPCFAHNPHCKRFDFSTDRPNEFSEINIFLPDGINNPEMMIFQEFYPVIKASGVQMV